MWIDYPMFRRSHCRLPGLLKCSLSKLNELPRRLGIRLERDGDNRQEIFPVKGLYKEMLRREVCRRLSVDQFFAACNQNHWQAETGELGQPQKCEAIHSRHADVGNKAANSPKDSRLQESLGRGKTCDIQAAPLSLGLQVEQPWRCVPPTGFKKNICSYLPMA